MPRKVDRVPNVWEPYMEGIWEFTPVEFSKMPRFGIFDEDGIPVGARMWTLTQYDLIYVQFSSEPITDWNAFWGLTNG